MTDQPSTTPTSAPAPAAAPVGSAWTPAQVESMHADAQRMIDRGAMSREDINKSLREAGVAELPSPGGQQQRGADGRFAPHPAELSPEAAAIDKAFPPARPEEFQMPNMLDDAGNYSAKADHAARGILADARVTREIGSYLAKTVDEISAKWRQEHPDGFEGLSDAQRQTHNLTTLAQLERLGFTPSRINLGRQLVQELDAKRPGVLRLLEITGAGSDPNIIAQIVLHAERLAARRAGGK